MVGMFWLPQFSGCISQNKQAHFKNFWTFITFQQKSSHAFGRFECFWCNLSRKRNCWMIRMVYLGFENVKTLEKVTSSKLSAWNNAVLLQFFSIYTLWVCVRHASVQFLMLKSFRYKWKGWLKPLNSSRNLFPTSPASVTKTFHLRD